MSTLTSLGGLRVGHATDLEGGTGCTVVLFDAPALGGVDIGGGFASTRQADSLRPGGRVNEVHAFLFTGGSAFGMDAASGCMAYLEERGIGFRTTTARIPTVPTAVLYDLGIGRDARPDAAMGRLACERASADPVEEGNVGAGTGCTVAKRLGYAGAWKGGIGSTFARVGRYGVGVLVAVNALGDIRDPRTGRPIAVARGPEGWESPVADAPTREPVGPGPGENTTLALVCTDAPFDRNQLCHLARMAQGGMARAIHPHNSPFDGDIVFAASIASREAARADDLVLAELGEAAIELVAEAIVRGVRAARPLHGVPAVSG
ncbi:MAG: P1 family peptidase [Pseudomonadota bacterium]|nr:MAG: peptidase S58 [Pseudomonadota bacterium]